MTLSGTGFAPGPVNLTLFSSPVDLGAPNADASGAFTATVQIPPGTAPGNHHIVASSVNAAQQASAPLTVMAQPAAGATGSVPPQSPRVLGTGENGTLAVTGGKEPIIAGLALLAAALLSRFLRRRGQPAPVVRPEAASTSYSVRVIR